MNAQDTKAVELALGRIFRLGSRPTQPGDVEDYERCRAIVMDILTPVPAGYEPNYARDHNKGCA